MSSESGDRSQMAEQTFIITIGPQGSDFLRRVALTLTMLTMLQKVFLSRYEAVRPYQILRKPVHSRREHPPF